MRHAEEPIRVRMRIRHVFRFTLLTDGYTAKNKMPVALKLLEYINFKLLLKFAYYILQNMMGGGGGLFCVYVNSQVKNISDQSCVLHKRRYIPMTTTTSDFRRSGNVKQHKWLIPPIFPTSGNFLIFLNKYNNKTIIKFSFHDMKN